MLKREIKVTAVTFGDDRSQLDLLLLTYVKLVVEHRLRERINRQQGAKSA